MALVVAASGGLYAWVASSLAADPQRVINLVTYMYDRKWPPEVDYRRFLVRMGFVGALPFALWIAREALRPSLRPPWRSLPLCGLVAFSIALSTWCIDRYMPGISPTWSQQGLFDAYYGACTPSEPAVQTLSGRRLCEQKLVAYKMNWRGETFHSDNTLVPLRDDKDYDHFLSTGDGKREFFALVEYSRLESQLKAKLSKERRRKVRRVHEGNVKFLLVRVPAEGEG